MILKQKLHLMENQQRFIQLKDLDWMHFYLKCHNCMKSSFLQQAKNNTLIKLFNKLIQKEESHMC